MTTTINASSSAGLVQTADTSTILQLQTNGTAALTVDASQNVGIGITSPTRKLAVSGTWTNTGDYLMDSGDPQLAWTSGTLRFKYGGLSGTEAARFDSSGNMGLGATPSAWYTGYTAFQVGVNGSVWANRTTADTNIVGLGSNQFLNAGATNRLYISNGFATRYEQSSGTHAWYNAASGTAGNAISFTQAMTLDSSGRLLVGTTTAEGQQGLTITPNGSAGAAFLVWNRADTASGSTAASFRNNGTAVGTISYTNTATAYNTSSDYRLKENVQPMTGALAKVTALKPRTYKWKADGSDGEGFIAHELAEVVPDCVSGEKDAVDADGNPQYQGIDTSFLVATLTAAIQELKAIVDAQGAEIAALKGATA